MDQGVIRNLKTNYRGRLVPLLHRALEKNQSYPRISILQAMKTRPDSWEAVTKETVINCFKKAEINSDVQEAAIADSDDSFKDLQKKLNELKSADPSMVPKDVS